MTHSQRVKRQSSNFYFLCAAVLGGFLYSLPVEAQPEIPFTVIDREQVHDIYEKFPEFLSKRIESGDLPVRVGDLPSQYKSQLKADTSKAVPFPDGGLSEIPSLGKPLPYQISLQSPEVAQALYWNAQSVIHSSGYVQWALALETFFQENRAISLEASFIRLPYLGAELFPQFFRELFLVSAPASLQGYSWLTYRARNNLADTVWTWSPALKKIRRLTSSNRSDGLVRSPFSLNDMFTWSSLPLMSRGKATAQTVLAPFVTEAFWRLNETAEDCKDISLVQSDKVISYPHIAVPEAEIFRSSLFVPREMISLSFIDGDHYSVYGRQVIWIDKLSGAPVYKLVFSRKGRVLKWLLTSWLPYKDKSGEDVLLPAFTYVYDVGSRAVTLIRYKGMKTCKKPGSILTLDHTDPGKLGPILEGGNLFE